MGNSAKPENKSDLCNRSQSVVADELQNRRYNRNSSRQTCVFIVNDSSYPLEYLNSGSYEGFFQSAAIKAFQQETVDCAGNKIQYGLKPTYVGGILHSKKAGTAGGSVGFVSFKVAGPGRNVVVACGFSTALGATNSCGIDGIDLRLNDGISTKSGKIQGHYVDSAGAVDDIKGLVTRSYYEESGYSSECCGFVKVTCHFNNGSWSEFTFTICDHSVSQN